MRRFKVALKTMMESPTLPVRVDLDARLIERWLLKTTINLALQERNSGLEVTPELVRIAFGLATPPAGQGFFFVAEMGDDIAYKNQIRFETVTRRDDGRMVIGAFLLHGVRALYAFEGAPTVRGALRTRQVNMGPHWLRLRWDPPLEDGDTTMQPAAQSKPMSPEEWMAMQAEVQEGMRLLVRQLVTPLAVRFVDQPAQAVGTGSYLSLRGAQYVLTNEHVVADAVGGQLHHMPIEGGDYHACPWAWIAEPKPVDVALSRIPAEILRSRNVQAEQIDEAYAPVEGELLFLFGFPGTHERRERVDHHDRHVRTEVAETLNIPAIHFTTLALADQPPAGGGFDPAYHVAVGFPAAASPRPGEPSREVPSPEGLSGTLLWDTRRVFAHSRGLEWSPSMARICGLIRADYASLDAVVATRIEHVRSSLLGILRHERAYLRWLDRGQPLWDDLADWGWAEKGFEQL